jgi:hypothetical protein
MHSRSILVQGNAGCGVENQQSSRHGLCSLPPRNAFEFQKGRIKYMLWTILMVLLVLWLLGLVGGIGGSLIHLLLLVALVVLILQLVTGRRAAI